MPRGNKILIRSGTTTPSASDFATNEPAWDRTAKKLYVKAGDGTMVEIGAGGGGTTEILEYATTASFPATGTTARIYLATDTSRLYRWDSSGVYVELGAISAYDSRWEWFKPLAPSNVVGTAGNAQVSLTWTGNGFARGPNLDYLIQYSSNGGTTWTNFSDSYSDLTSATVTGLQNEVSYVFRVAAVSGIGTGPWSAASAAVTPTAGDALWSKVRLLLSMDGSNNGTSFTDASLEAQTVTRGGSAVTVTGVKKFGTASGYFAASGDHLSVADASSLELGSRDFAIEMWINTTNSSQYSTLISRCPNSFGGGMWTLMMNHASATAGDLAFYVGDVSTGSPTLLGGSGLRDGAWHHIAVSRSGSAWNLYVDGTRVATATSSATIADISGAVRIGDDQFYGRQYVGYIDDLRVTVGSARYTGASITAPTSAMPSVSATAWTPADLSPTLWLDASVASSLYDATSGGSLTGSGGTVRRWEDQSGNGNHVTGSDGPTRSVASINSRDSLAFAGPPLTRSALNLSSASAASLFAVIKFATSGDQVGVAFGTGSSYAALTIEANLRSAGQHSASFGSNSGATENQATGGTVNNTTRAFGAVYGSSVGKLYIGGTSVATVSRAQTLNSGSGFSVGAYFASGYALSGNICEIVYVPSEMTTGEIASLQSYFATKWGV